MYDEIERRPATGATVSSSRFPAAWTERYGPPPVAAGELEKWLVRAIKNEPPTRRTEDSVDALVAEAKAMLARPTRMEQRTATLIAEADRVLGRRPRQRLTTTPKLARKTGPSVGTFGGTGVLRGLLVPFMSLSGNLGGFREQFHPDAFIEDDWADVVSLWNHDRHALLGSVRGSTLALRTTTEGVEFEVRPPTTGVGAYVNEIVARGDVHGASLGFFSLKDDWHLDEREKPIVTIKRARLLEASLTWRPAYRATRVAARSAPVPATAADRAEMERQRREFDCKRRAFDRTHREILRTLATSRRRTR